jgi:hypothetical protein
MPGLDPGTSCTGKYIFFNDLARMAGSHPAITTFEKPSVFGPNEDRYKSSRDGTLWQ